MDNNYNQNNYQNDYQNNYQNNYQSDYQNVQQNTQQNVPQNQSNDPYLHLSNMAPGTYVPPTHPEKKGSIFVVSVFILGSLAIVGGCIYGIMKVVDWFSSFGPL